MTEHIERTTFGELIAEGALEIGDGFRAKNSELGGDGLIFLRAGHVTDTHIDFDGVERFHRELEPRLRSKTSKPGDTIVTTKGNSTGRTAFVTPSMPPFVYSPHLSYWRSRNRERIEGGFLRYWSKGPEFVGQLSGMKASTDMAPYLSLVDQKRLRITLPPIDQQRAVAQFLGTLDDKIELNRRMSETLEAMARALFRSWFVDFDPVRAKTEGRDLGLPKPLADLFPDSFEDSELGAIPAGWRVSTVGEVCERVAMGPFGSDIKTDNFVETGVPVVRGANLRNGFLDDQFVFLTELKADELRNANAFPGDIVITHRGTLGQVGMIPLMSRYPRYVVSQSQLLLSVAPTKFSARFLCMYLRSPAGQHALLANTSQTGVPAIARPTTSVKAIPLIAPRGPVLEAFDGVVESLYQRIEHAKRESRALARLRDSLLPRLISGAVELSPHCVPAMEDSQ